MGRLGRGHQRGYVVWDGGGGVRDDMGSWKPDVSRNERDGPPKGRHLPFQTDRFNRDRVGRIASVCSSFRRCVAKRIDSPWIVSRAQICGHVGDEQGVDLDDPLLPCNP